MAKKQAAYGNESIQSLKGADRVRKRPSVIFGSDGLEGCQHSIFEILSNAIDEARMGFHFPPEWAGRLAGCTVGLPDGTLWDVVGDPRGHMAANCPGPYSVNFTATRHTGAVPR